MDHKTRTWEGYRGDFGVEGAEEKERVEGFCHWALWLCHPSAGFGRLNVYLGFGPWKKRAAIFSCLLFFKTARRGQRGSGVTMLTWLAVTCIWDFDGAQGREAAGVEAGCHQADRQDSTRRWHSTYTCQ